MRRGRKKSEKGWKKQIQGGGKERFWGKRNAIFLIRVKGKKGSRNYLKPAITS